MAIKIKGKNINLREVNVDDAEFILSLRTDPRYNEHLGKTENNISSQIRYIEQNLKKKDDFYFIVEAKDRKRFGCIRIYNIKNGIFNYGSWIMIKESPPYFALETNFLLLDFAYYYLKLKKTEFEVRKGNSRVVAFHKRMGAKIIHEDDLNYYFLQTKEDYENVRKKYSRYTNKNLSCEVELLH